MKTVLTAGLFFFMFVGSYCQSDQQALEQALFNLPDVAFQKISKPGDPYLQYALRIKQPLDHQHPEKGSFYQQVILTHRGFDQPTVMNINGYNLYKARNEVVQMLHANELNIEYRFFGSSMPDSLQWEYLNYDQVAADLHRLNQMFRTIYNGKWISTGISRGGQTTIIYRYYYPDDVDVAIPYVAPIINGQEDQRIYTFLDTMGTNDCRKKIFNFQVYLLRHEKEMLERLQWYVRGGEMHFNYLGSLGKAFEFAVLEYPFSFWQVTDLSCSTTPVNASVDSSLQHLLKVVDVRSFCDREMTEMAAHYYQATYEGGYYGYDARPFKKYLHYIQVPEPSASFPPKVMPSRKFDPTFMDRVEAWLDKQGNNFLYIYGGRDTWSACRVKVSSQVNSRLFMIPGADHYMARVKNMSPDMQKEFETDLKKMLGIDPDMKVFTPDNP